jgi:cytochrome oxidase Cu insertion factor (SCO1/SenC/PrrC family)
LSQAASLSFTAKRKSELLISVFENQLTYEHFFIDLNDDPYWIILTKKMEEIKPIKKKFKVWTVTLYQHVENTQLSNEFIHNFVSFANK